MKFQDLALLTVDERSDYIRTAAAEFGLSELIVEKDFSVVWLLEQLFALSTNLGPFTFKGGTSRSKGYDAIQRFSEDIDISIGRATLGFPDEEYFYETPSAKEAKRRVEQIRTAVSKYAFESLLPALRDQLAGKIEGAWSLESGAGPKHSRRCKGPLRSALRAALATTTGFGGPGRPTETSRGEAARVDSASTPGRCPGPRGSRPV